jgi:hypothetical protein
MFCWPCIIVYRYSETNVMHFLFNLLRIKGLYIFRASNAQNMYRPLTLRRLTTYIYTSYRTANL